MESRPETQWTPSLASSEDSGNGEDEVCAILFAYGTLGPADAQSLAAEGWTPDHARGRLYDLGPYPILVDWNGPTAPWVAGHRRPARLRELEEELDPYEGVDAGLFHRVELTLGSGVRAWVYIYPHPVPPTARGPIAVWSGRRGVKPRAFESSTDKA